MSKGMTDIYMCYILVTYEEYIHVEMDFLK